MMHRCVHYCSALLHCYATGNLLAAPGSLFLIDWEFATVGPVSFDIGNLLGNLMLAVLSLKGMHELEEQQQQQQQHVDAPAQQSQSQTVQQQQDSDSQAGGAQQAATRRQQAEWLLQVCVRPQCSVCCCSCDVVGCQTDVTVWAVQALCGVLDWAMKQRWVP